MRFSGNRFKIGVLQKRKTDIETVRNPRRYACAQELGWRSKNFNVDLTYGRNAFFKKKNAQRSECEGRGKT